MAYENQTYETIMRRVLERVPAELDRREGSMIWNAAGPAAVELAMAYTALDFILQATFAGTAPREYLILRAAERGMSPKPAAYAVLRADFNVEVPIGSRFSLGTLNYAVTERKPEDDTPESVAYRVRCESAGAVGNAHLGNLIPIDYIDGLTRARLTGLLIPGEDEEDTEVFRKRYIDSLSSQAFGGNAADYREKVSAIPGVGGVKVFPVWKGGGTVKVVIAGSGGGVPSAELIDAVQTALDPLQNQGEGLGLAPIGHIVTVEGVSGRTVDLSLTLEYQDGWDWAAAQSYILAAIDEYFSALAQGWQNTDGLTVRISQIETRLLECPGVEDVRDTLLDGAPENITLSAVQIPVRGVVSG